MEKNQKYIKKGEKGAITLFVLLACLFFVFILTGVYVSNLNKLQVQEQEIKQIQENYARDIERIDEIYENILTQKGARVTLELTQTLLNPNDAGWTKEGVILDANAEIESQDGEEPTKEFVKYIITNIADFTAIPEAEWITATANEKQKIEYTTPEDEPITTNGTYYFHVEVKDIETGEIEIKTKSIEVGNIDRIAPIAGTLEDGEGNKYSTEKEFITSNNVVIEKKDGSDQEPGSGHKETTYTIIKDYTNVYTTTDENGQTIAFENLNNPSSTTLTEGGTYTITVKTTDNAGNTAENVYTITIDRAIPVLALKHNDENGELYESGTWTKDDLYGEITIDSKRTVEKYQYSTNGVNGWNEFIVFDNLNLNYTTKFPMGENKPEIISGVTNNGEYYFEVQADGTLKPNNSGVNSKTANSYFEIDLTNYPAVNLELTINTTISSESNYDYGFAEIKQDATAPTFNKNNTYLIKVSGSTKTADHITTLTGGGKYYLHIGYSKDGSTSKNQDTFIINSITMKSALKDDLINFEEYQLSNNKGTFKLREDINKKIYVGVLYTGEEQLSIVSEPVTIMIDKTAPVIESTNIVITSKEDGKVNVKVKEEGSGTKGYYISTDSTEPTESSEWVSVEGNEFGIENIKTNTTYNLWVKDKVGYISEKQEIVVGTANYVIDDETYTETLEQAITAATDGSTIKLLNDYTDTSSATFNKNVTFDVQGFTLIRSATISIGTSKTVEITGTGKITTEANSVRTITNNGTLTVNNSITIENMSTSTSNAPLYNNSTSAIININDNAQIIGYYRGIYNRYGTINVNGGTIEATYKNSSAYGIYNNNSSSKTYMYNGTVKGYYGIYNYNDSSLLEITGGKVIGTEADGIYARGITNIYGGRIEGKTRGIYGYSSEKVTIGRQEDELSITQPAIYGGNYGIYMSNESYSFNFYNGVIISNTKETAYNSAVNLREGHIPYTYLDYEVEQRYCTILTPIVGNIIMEAIPTEYTNGNVTVKITYPYVEATRQYSENGTEWKDANQYIQEIIIAENKTIYARTLNESGMITDEDQIEINNIDKEKPVVTVVPTTTNYIVTETDATIDIGLTITATDTGVSGLDKMQYAWAKEGEEITYIDFTNTITINKENLGVGRYNLYLNVTDKAGNEAELKQLRYNVKYQEPVAKIGETTYLTVQAAVDACSKESGETQTTIEMLKSTDEEFTTYVGQNIILDLKGYTIGSSNTETPTCTNNATLQLIDTSSGKNGKIESLNEIAILNNGTYTLGDNSTSIENEVPTIYGQKIGIQNNNIFNFYDGKIQGKTPINGKVTQTPEEYGPVSTDYNNGITTVQLGIVTGYEARIEWVYYTKLQDAIEATQINKRETVTIIKNMQIQEILEITATKDFILDLDGYKITATVKNIILNNNGNIEITDTSTEQMGTIEIENDMPSYGIYNAGAGSVKVTGGKIISSSSANNSGDSYSYGIYNASTGDIEIKGGEISSNETHFYGYGIYNAGTGGVKVTGGNIISSTISFSYGIYNASAGSVEVTGGTISSSSSSCYGIYNASTGSVEVTGGTISSSSSSNCYGIYNAGAGSIKVIEGKISSTSSGTYSNRSYGIYNTDVGSIEVIGGEISCSGSGYNGNYVYGITNTSTGNILVSGGKISSIGNSNGSSYGICNNSTGSIKVTGGKVISSRKNGHYSYGIYNASAGSVEVTGGEISCSGNSVNYGILNTTEGSITIGTKEDEFVSQEVPNITSSEGGGYGISNKFGNVEFYNGIIQGKIRAIIGNVTTIREGYEIKNELIDELDAIYLTEAINTETIVKIGEQEFCTIKEAIESIENNEETTIEVLKDFELKEALDYNKNIILDLKGYSIINNYYQIKNTGILKITDTSNQLIGKIENYETLIGIINKGEKLVIEKGTISISNSSGRYDYGIYNYDVGSVEVTGGTINSDNDGYAVYNNGEGIIKIRKGTISGRNYGVYNSGTGTIEVIGGTISSREFGIYNEGKGSIEVTGGTISSSNSATYAISGIYNDGAGSVKVTGGTISSSNSYASYGIWNGSRGTIEVIGGMISSRGSFSNSYGIVNNDRGSIIIGIKGDGLVLQEEPYIKGEYNGTSTSYRGYGIYNTEGSLYFYDGKIEGTTKAVYDTITEREENTELNYNEDETILTLSSEIGNIAQIGDITYKTLEEAINSVAETQTTIKLLRNATFTNQDTTIIIPNTKNIILDLNGYKIVSTIPENLIKNEGILEIKDSSEGNTGTLRSSEETTINNAEGAKLTITGGTIENRLKQTIYNEGSLMIEGGILSCSSSRNNSYVIYNNGIGIVELRKGILSSDCRTDDKSSYGIFNITGSVIIEGGTINSNRGKTSYGIYNQEGSIKLKEAMVKSDTYTQSYGLYNNGGNVEVTGGTIHSSGYRDNCGISNNNRGSITIGTKGDKLVIQDKPNVIGEGENGYGIYNNSNSNFYFYDGKIEGTTQAVSGTITEVENMTELLITKDTSEIIQLQEKETNLASVNGVEYDSIQEAILECGTTESTIKILRNADPGATIVIESGQNITIDLNGYTVKNYPEITNEGTLKIIDTSSGQAGKMIGLTGTVVLNEGTMELNGGSITDTGYGINNKGILTVNGGNLTNNTYGIYNDSGTINVISGIIASNTYGIYNVSGTTTITGGSITSNENGVYVSGGTVDINSTGITNNNYGVYNSRGIINIKEGSQVSSNVGIYNSTGIANIGESGTMNSSSPVIIGEEFGIVNDSSGTANMYDGQIKGKTGATQGYITNTETGYVVGNKVDGEYFVDYLALAGTISTVAQVNGIDYSNLQSAINSIVGEGTVLLTNGINSTQSYTIAEGQNITLDMNGKTISSDLEVTINNAGSLTIIDSSGMNVGKISSSSGTAIVNSGTLTLGQDDGTVNQELITIEGTTYGIENSGTLNFYDGTINGGSAISGAITNRATGYIIRTTIVNGKERYYLSVS